jgi:hypothetical protein
MNKRTLLIGLCILLVLVSGCDNSICNIGWRNETHFCNEYHHKERIPIEEPEDYYSKFNFSLCPENKTLIQITCDCCNESSEYCCMAYCYKCV